MVLISRRLGWSAGFALCALIAGCAGDPELANYTSGGRARPRGVGDARRELATIGGVVGVAGLAAGGVAAEAAVDDALRRGTDEWDSRRHGKR